MNSSPLIRLIGDVRFNGGPVGFTCKPLQVFAALAVRAGEVVGANDLIHEVWGDDRVNRLGNLQLYIRRLRKLEIVDILTSTNERGYTMKIDPDEVDLLVFIKNQRQIRHFLEQGQLREADHLLAVNMPLNEGPLFGDLRCGEILMDYKDSYEEYVSAMARDCFELRLRQGRHREVVTDLLVACQKWPYDEDLAAMLILALHRCNRRIEALNAYNRLDRAIRGNLGLDVSRWSQKLYALVLADDECLNDLNIQFSA